jgi:hypothetical protein
MVGDALEVTCKLAKYFFLYLLCNLQIHSLLTALLSVPGTGDFGIAFPISSGTKPTSMISM